VLRGNLSAGLEDVALWHERDISHSSVERIILPDSSLLAYYVLVKMRGIVEGMQVHPERMLENLDRSYGLVFSQPVLLALVGAGLGRDEAYRIVQDAARTAWDQRRPLRTVLEEDARVPLSASALDEAFSLDHALRNVGLVFEALEKVET
jgi:adenylosuccinate lyase